MSAFEAAFEAKIGPVVEQVMAAAQVPGIALAAARDNGSIVQHYAGMGAEGQPLGPDSLFPVASITKLATALTVLRLVDARQVALDDELALHLPEAAAAQHGVTLRKLLSHIAGVPLDLSPDAAPYELGLDWRRLAEACLHAEAEWPPDTRVQYSNVGYGLLALVVERRTGQEFADALGSLVLAPLGVEGYLGVEPARPPVRQADVRGKQAGTELEPYNSAFWRSLALPWAGMLTNAQGALALVRAYRGVPEGFLSTATLNDATRNQVGDLGGGMSRPLIWDWSPWGLGPELRGRKSPHWAPPDAVPESFGHAGMSGCLAWSDPAAGVAWAMLGSRTADSGWLLRHGTAIGGAILAAAQAEDDDAAAGA